MLARRAAKHLATAMRSLDGCTLVAVPPSRKRLQTRLGHLPDVVVNEWHRAIEGSAVCNVLARIDHNPPRWHCGPRGPTLCASSGGGRKPVVLVDDVITTGLTMTVAIQTLRAADWDVQMALCLADARQISWD